ncbi:MAG: rhodanese-like domain-containing protein [Thiotrichales bacterium]|nr:rhodanese-like domain-containing protein [Thiotrichales bacterium]
MSQSKQLSNLLLACVIAASSFLSTQGFAASGPSVESVEGATTIGAKEAKELWLKGAVFIDTRKTADWDAGRIPGALHISIKKPEFNPDYIAQYVAKDHPVVSYCNAQLCHRAASGAKKLVEYGYTQVYYFRLGFPSWKNANYPYE